MSLRVSSCFDINADALYRRLPDFTKWNNQLDWHNTCKIAILSLLGLILDRNPNSLRHRVSLYSTLGVFTIKATLSVCAYIHNKIWINTEDYEQKEAEQAVWGVLLPPTNPAITNAEKSWIKSERAISHAFNGFFTGIDEVFMIPTFKSYQTLEELESECGKWMDDSLAIAQAVREDLKKWSGEERFKTKDGTPVTNGALLKMEPGCSHELYYAPWLYQGFFRLPTAYRRIFNLTYPFAEISKMTEFLKQSKIAQDAVKNYPQKNREHLKGWKEKFFTPGTKQYQWREQYNEEMGKLAEQLGGLTIENVPDIQFVNWGQLHGENDYKFVQTPDTRPT